MNVEFNPIIKFFIDNLSVVIGCAISSITAFIVAYIIMTLTNRHNLKMQKRNELIRLYNNILMLLADFYSCCLNYNQTNIIIYKTSVRENSIPEVLQNQKMSMLWQLRTFRTKLLIYFCEREELNKFAKDIDNAIELATSGLNSPDNLEKYLSGIIDEIQNLKRQTTEVKK